MGEYSYPTKYYLWVFILLYFDKQYCCNVNNCISSIFVVDFGVIPIMMIVWIGVQCKVRCFALDCALCTKTTSLLLCFHSSLIFPPVPLSYLSCKDCIVLCQCFVIKGEFIKYCFVPVLSIKTHFNWPHFINKVGNNQICRKCLWMSRPSAQSHWVGCDWV